MALVNCKECGTEVSDSALKCPKCGVQLRKLQRSFFGKMVKWSFIGFNVLMILWMIGGLGSASDHYSQMGNDAQRAGAAIGTGIGMMMVGTIWVLGDIVIGIMLLFTRPKA